MKKYVIIGNGVAAIGCIEGIRAQEQTGTITVISGENHPCYCRPLISYLLEGKTDIKRMGYRPEGFYAQNGCTVMPARRAVAIGAGTVTLDDGSTVKYDKLCIATGSSPFVPPMQGLETVKSRFSFMTLDDALALDAAVNKSSRVLIIGAGLIGLKCAEGIKDKVKSITVCDLAGRVLSSILDDECAAKVQRRLEENGLHFALSDSVTRFCLNTAYLKSGKTVEFDVLVTAVGVRPNIALIKELGGACGRAITVNSKSQTSIDNIYAAGDCTESIDASCGQVKVMALMPNAYMQGRCAGVNMAGGDDVFDNAIPQNSIGLFGLHIMSAGSHDDSSEVYIKQDGGSIKKLFIKDGRLTGFILIGCTERAGVYTSLIRNRVLLDSVDAQALKNAPAIGVFNANTRRKMLGGVV